jgi:glycosyltransferase involved in cell wall biosynthesis
MRRPRLAIFTVGGERLASVRHRVFAYLPYLEREGFEVEVFEPYRSELGGRLTSRVGDLLRDVREVKRWDVALVQRKCYPWPFPWALRRNARRLVFDFDDALFLPPPLPKAPSPRVRHRYRKNFEATVRLMDGVMCGNAYLEKKARSFVDRTIVLPTGLDIRRWMPTGHSRKTLEEGPVVGWVGSFDNLPYLQAFAPAWQKLYERYPNMELRVVCDRNFHLNDVRVKNVRWRLSQEVEHFAGLDVGILPLTDGPWARGKCAFKAVQYMACGIPTVASPVGENLNLIHEGENGLFAATTDEWVEKISAVLEDDSLRERITRAARRTVMERYNLDVLAPELVAFLRSILGLK